MPKKRKALLIVLGVILLALIAGTVGFWAFTRTIFFEVDPIDSVLVGSGEEYEEGLRLCEAGYRITCPSFRNKTQWNLKNDISVYSVLNNALLAYAKEIAAEYKNYASLDYTVAIEPNKTLTVSFTGTGYFYDEREPVSLEKTFVFDIRDVSPEHLPTLIEE